MIFWKNLQKKTKWFFLTAIVLNILAVGLDVYAFSFLKEKSKEMAMIAGEIQAYEQSGEKLTSMRHLVDETRHEREKIDSLFVSGDDIVGFIGRIESLGRHAGVSLELKSVDVTKDDEGVLSLRFSTKGDWEGTLYFLALMESMPLRIETESVNLRNIKQVEQGKMTTFWSGDFKISLLSFLKT
ncbi:MAG: hypothetical protein NUV49_00420 [Patescibacteria group bacterium]|nr:hypothetical protein [Patescibacteria group bacterium]